MHEFDFNRIEKDLIFKKFIFVAAKNNWKISQKIETFVFNLKLAIVYCWFQGCPHNKQIKTLLVTLF